MHVVQLKDGSHGVPLIFVRRQVIGSGFSTVLDVHHLHQIRQIETPVVVPAGFGRRHLAQRAQARGAVASAMDLLKKNGMQVTTFSPVELAKLRDKLRPVTAKYGVTVGQELVKELQSDLEKARTAGKKK